MTVAVWVLEPAVLVAVSLKVVVAVTVTCFEPLVTGVTLLIP